MGAFRNIFYIVENNIEAHVLRNSSDLSDYARINDSIHSLERLLQFADNTKQISTVLGCEEIFKVNAADKYFKRVIFILYGNVRYKEPSQKPKIRDYMDEKYDPRKLQLNDRYHTQNICFLLDYFAPESFLYAMIYKVFTKPMEHLSFWRGFDSN